MTSSMRWDRGARSAISRRSRARARAPTVRSRRTRRAATSTRSSTRSRTRRSWAFRSSRSDHGARTLTTVTEAVEALVRATVALTDPDMGREWKWGVYDEEGLRFALLMTHHELRDLAVRLAKMRERQPTQAGRILAQYHEAYRDMTAVLATVRSEDLDRAPAEGEWPVRKVCDHMLGAEYGFLRVCRIGLERHRGGKTAEPTEDEWNAASAPYTKAREAATAPLATSGIDKIRDAFFDIHARNLRELSDITDPELGLPS